MGSRNWRPEPSIGPTCTARRDEMDGDDEDVQKITESARKPREHQRRTAHPRLCHPPVAHGLIFGRDCFRKYGNIRPQCDNSAYSFSRRIRFRPPEGRTIRKKAREKKNMVRKWPPKEKSPTQQIQIIRREQVCDHRTALRGGSVARRGRAAAAAGTTAPAAARRRYCIWSAAR